MDPKSRVEQMREAQRIAILKDQSIIPLHYQVDMYASSKKVKFIPRTDSKIWAFDIK
jgi:peptide/nickel transport system substrate-binding protein